MLSEITTDAPKWPQPRKICGCGHFICMANDKFCVVVAKNVWQMMSGLFNFMHVTLLIDSLTHAIINLFLQEQGVVQNFFSINCGLSIFFPIFVGIAIAYKLILHILGLVLACLIRKVKVDVLNDSRETVAIIYSSTVLLIVASLIVLVLNDSVNVVNIAWSVVVFLVSLVHLGLTFIPKVSFNNYQSQL